MRRIIFILPSLFVASLILVVSIFKTAELKYSFSPTPAPSVNKIVSDSNINYSLPKVGFITPASPVWLVRAAGDRVRLSLTIHSTKRSEVLLSLADNRLVNAYQLFENGDIERGVSTLTKAEKYLESAYLQQEKARLSGADTTRIVNKLALASQKHQLLISEMTDMAPSEAKSFIVQLNDYPDLVYERVQPLVLANLSAKSSF